MNLSCHENTKTRKKTIQGLTVETEIYGSPFRDPPIRIGPVPRCRRMMKRGHARTIRTLGARGAPAPPSAPSRSNARKKAEEGVHRGRLGRGARAHLDAQKAARAWAGADDHQPPV